MLGLRMSDLLGSVQILLNSRFSLCLYTKIYHPGQSKFQLSTYMASAIILIGQ